MKKYFFLGGVAWLFFEIANVYFIMPMPGSQDMNSICAAYFLYQFRWVFRIGFAFMIMYGWTNGNWKKNWMPILWLLPLMGIIYVINFKMAADKMFLQTNHVVFADASKNLVDSNRLVIGVIHNGEAKAYPIQFLGYHHQVEDRVGGKPLLITYCTVCRTGRVFDPTVNGKPEHFRLVGMDHFNAMLEDATTKSWWRQATGEAITGKLKGNMLREFFSTQMTLQKWVALYPNTLIMQEDHLFKDYYSPNMHYEYGQSRNALTGTDSLSWQKKSWVVGVKINAVTKAYDWNRLRQKRIIEDSINGRQILILLAEDGQSFSALEGNGQTFYLDADTLKQGNQKWTILGKPIQADVSLKSLPAYQEFWHSWKYFNPNTLH